MATILKPTKSEGHPKPSIALSDLTAVKFGRDRHLQLSDMHSKSDRRGHQPEPRPERSLQGLTYDPKNFRLFNQMEFREALWRFLLRPDNLIRMQTATYFRRPAVEPLSPGLLAQFGSELAEDRIKQMIGHMVAQIMRTMGYELDAEGLRITRPGLFSTGARYRALDRDPSEKITKMTWNERQNWLKRNGGDDFNRWLDEQVRRQDGSIDEEKLQAIAKRYVVAERQPEIGANYRRLNIGVLLRARVAGNARDDG
jgi:hypothetical protein